MSEASKRAKARYMRENVTRITVDFYPSETDLVLMLKNQPKKQTYIKNLIRADIVHKRNLAKKSHKMGLTESTGVLRIKNMEKPHHAFSLQADKRPHELSSHGQPELELGYYAEKRYEFLKDNLKKIYYDLLDNCRLVDHLTQIEEKALISEQIFMRDMMKDEGVTEQLKEEYPFIWASKMEHIRENAREKVLWDIVYRV